MNTGQRFTTILIASVSVPSFCFALTTDDFSFEAGASQSNYSQKGLPNNLYSTSDDLQNDVLNGVYSMLPEGTEVNPDFIADDRYSSIHIDGDLDGAAYATVSLTFLNEGAGYRNSLGYFVYQTDNPPTDKDQIDAHTIVFPNTSKANDGEMVQGHTMDLSVQLSPGQSLGFFVIPNGWGWSGSYNNIASLGSWNTPFYSVSDLNPESTPINRKHNVIFLNVIDESLVIGFEDLYRPQGDNDFNDLLFSAKISPFSALEGVEVDGSIDSNYEPLVFNSDPERTITSVYPSANGTATMAFEDRWPLMGDYDFNDVVLQYQVTELLNTQRQVKTVTYDYTVQAMGAAYSNGIALSLPNVQSDNIESVTLTKNNNPVEHTIVESGDDDLTMIITPNLHKDLSDLGVLTDSCNYYMTQPGCNAIQQYDILSYQLVVELSTPVDRSDIGYPPYDSFIFASENKYHGDFTDTPPGYTWQTHFKHRGGTAMMNQSFFNMNDDDSDGQYHFLTSNNMPWAINIRDQWDHPKERVDISDAYPHFPSWVISEGATDTNWYQNPQTQLIVPADSE